MAGETKSPEPSTPYGEGGSEPGVTPKPRGNPEPSTPYGEGGSEPDVPPKPKGGAEPSTPPAQK